MLWNIHLGSRCWCSLAASLVAGSIPGLPLWLFVMVVGLLVVAVFFIPFFVAKIRVLTKLLSDKVSADGKVVTIGVISCFAYDAIKSLVSLST